MSQKFDEQTYYEILEISPSSPEHEIHRAYQKAKKTYSPDSPALYTMFTPDEANDLSKLIEEAYAVLSNHAARREYDSRILGRKDGMQQVRSENLDSLNGKRLGASHSRPVVEKRVPEGFARTKHGAYEINEDFESEIQNSGDFDGELIARIRNYKQVNLENLSREIRVSKTYLMAIEQNAYETLPAEVFVRGFIVQIAKALGLEPEKVAKSYMKKMRDAKQT